MSDVRSRMQAIAKSINEKLPEGYGFFVLCFRYNQKGGRVEYASNAQREDVVRAMQEFIDRNPMQKPERN